MPSLNVTLLVDTNETDSAPTDSELLASRDQAGGGAGDSERPTRILTAEQSRNQAGEPLGADAVDAEALEAGTPADQLVTNRPSDREIAATPETTDTAAPVPMRSAALLQQEAAATLAAEIDDRVANTQSDPAAINAPNTRQAVVAEYMVGWRQRVERVGTANFPLEMLNGGASPTRPVVEVTIDPGGGLHEVVLRRSSGSPELDQAALRILELAAPFEPLPAAILAEHDMLRFSYEWDFSTGPR